MMNSKKIIEFLNDGSLPDDSKVAKKIAAQASSFAVVNGILFFVDSKHNHKKRCAVPHHLRVR